MVLSSQSGREGSNRISGMSWKKRRARMMRRTAAAGGMIVLALIVWSWGGDDEAPADPAVDAGAVAIDASATASEPMTPPSNAAPISAPMRNDTPAAVLAQTQPNVSTPTPAPAPVARPAVQPQRQPQPATPRQAAADTTTNRDRSASGTSGPHRATAMLASVNTNAAPAPRTRGGSSNSVVGLITQGRQLAQQGRLVEARDRLNRALQGQISRADAAAVRADMRRINDVLVFSPKVAANDPYAEACVVKPGEVVSKIASRYDVPWQFICHINGNLDPRRLRAGARLKVVKGPFHVVVDKSEFRLDIYLGDMFVRSFDVGLGEHGSTPLGKFEVKRHSKLERPEWVNPRTGEKFAANDPENPLGGYWIGLQGIDDNTRDLAGYGIHGTIHPESIGTEASMGCVRLIPDDVKIIYLMLIEQKSKVAIVQ